MNEENNKFAMKIKQIKEENKALKEENKALKEFKE